MQSLPAHKTGASIREALMESDLDLAKCELLVKRRKLWRAFVVGWIGKPRKRVLGRLEVVVGLRVLKVDEEVDWKGEDVVVV